MGVNKGYKRALCMREAIQRGDGSRSQAKIIKQAQIHGFSSADTIYQTNKKIYTSTPIETSGCQW